MKLNCKPGDLAIVVKSWAGNEGKIVRCIKQANLIGSLNPNGSTEDEFIWAIDIALPDFNGDLASNIADSQLRPIRPSEGADETLSWLDVPVGELA